MTTFTYTWNSTFLGQPADTEDESLGAQRIRDTKAAVGERLVVDHSLAGDPNDGKHNWATLRNRASVVAVALDANDGQLFASQVSGNTELFYQDSSGRVVQLTNIGSVSGPAAPIIPAGTNMPFMQAAVPAGWTLRTDLNDQLIRVSSTTGGGTGGSWTMSGVTIGSHVLTVAELPSHDHGLSTQQLVATTAGTLVYALVAGTVAGLVSGTSVGGGAGHSHTVASDGTWRPAYVDCVVGTKS